MQLTTEPVNDFFHLDLSPSILEALKKMGFQDPTPVQRETIGPALQGADILGSAPTGTGKTAAFSIPLVDWILKNPSGHALIMTPTRELATQVLKTVIALLGEQRHVKVALLIGGDSLFQQKQQLFKKPRIVIGTPGRINDHLTRKSLRLDKVGFLVLDETDRMLDMGFREQLETIVTELPKERQTLLFSATLPKNIVKVSEQYLKNAIRVEIGSTNLPVEDIEQITISTSEEKKYDMLIEQLLKYPKSTIIFAKTKMGCDELCERLRDDQFRADTLHGDLSQRRRQRVIESFRAQKFKILVATDVAARGLDIHHVEYVINFDLPQNPEDYTHRIGRTGRAGRKGVAISLITGRDHGKWRAISRLLTSGEVPDQRPMPYGQKKRPFGSERPKRPWSPSRSAESRSEDRTGSYPRKSSFSHSRPASPLARRKKPVHKAYARVDEY